MVVKKHSRSHVGAALTVLWTLKSDRDAINLSSSRVADVADGLAVLERKRHKKGKKYLTDENDLILKEAPPLVQAAHVPVPLTFTLLSTPFGCQHSLFD